MEGRPSGAGWCCCEAACTGTGSCATNCASVGSEWMDESDAANRAMLERPMCCNPNSRASPSSALSRRDLDAPLRCRLVRNKSATSALGLEAAWPNPGGSDGGNEVAAAEAVAAPDIFQPDLVV